MRARQRSYVPEKDYMKIRDLIIESYALYNGPFNWLIDRWNFCRFQVIPTHNHYNVQYFGVPTRPKQDFRDELYVWEKTIGIWESEDEKIVAVAHSENEEPGEAWIQIHPDYFFLYEEIIDYIEENLADRVDGTGFVKLYVNSNSELERIVSNKGYRKLPFKTPILKQEITKKQEVTLPDGYTLLSVEEEDNPVERGKVKMLSFGGRYPPSQWLPPSVMKEMQKAPDYKKDLDLFIKAPNGDYVSFCTIWVDQKNEYAVFEPVGTHVEYQGMGIASELLKEGLNRMKAYGAKCTYMQSSVPFYKRFGFKETGKYTVPWIKYFNY
ncbi:MAG: GNAT family N-acetyltransferase [Kosmotoga sp.]|nr:MAG: GNAT family N-acetyltransferase [Kosmotoga sp.]